MASRGFAVLNIETQAAARDLLDMLQERVDDGQCYSCIGALADEVNAIRTMVQEQFPEQPPFMHFPVAKQTWGCYDTLCAVRALIGSAKRAYLYPARLMVERAYSNVV
jgi:hypothetical protein